MVLHAGVTVRDILELPETQQQGLTLLAGAGGLDRPVRWAHVVEVPETTDWLRSGDLLPTTGMTWPPGTDIDQVIMKLVDKGVAGVVFAPGMYWKEIPDELRRGAEAVNLPIIHCPWKVRFVDLTEAVHRFVLRRQYEVMERLFALHRDLTHAAMHSQTLSDLAGVLGRFMDKPVLFTDLGLQVIGHWEEDGDLDPARRELLRTGQPPEQVLQYLRDTQILTWLRTATGARLFPGKPDLGLGKRVVCPITARGELLGALWILATGADMGDLELQAAELTSTVAALHIWHQRALGETEERAGFSLVDSLLQGTAWNESAWQERLRLRGFDPEGSYVVIASTISDMPGEEARMLAAMRDHARLVHTTLRDLGQAPLLTVQLGQVVGLVALDTGGRIPGVWSAWPLPRGAT